MHHSVVSLSHKIGLLAIACVFLSAGHTQPFEVIAADKSPGTTVTDSSERDRIQESFGNLPLSFEANMGQVDGAVKFLARGVGYTFFLTSSEAVLDFLRNHETAESSPSANHVIRLKPVGSNPNPKVSGHHELPGKIHYFIGNDPARVHTDVSLYAKVRMEDVYPGIDLLYYGNRRQLEFDWIVAPGCDPNVIRFAVEGIADLRIDAEGNLLMDESGGLRLKKPLVYQESEGSRTEVVARYVLLGKREAGFDLGDYDASLPLIIDPVITYSYIFGGTGGGEVGLGIAVDSFGNAFVTGYTPSSDFPVQNGAQGIFGGSSDAFVSKLNASGNALVYSTYLGGDNNDYCFDIALDSSGNAYVVGETWSSDFPTVNALQPTHGGGTSDGFVTKLNPSGSAIIYSTFLGGSDGDKGNGIAVDSFGNAYVTGETESVNFPILNAFQNLNAGLHDVFVTKLNAAGNGMIYSSYLGGVFNDFGKDIALDSCNNAYITGQAGSADFPTENPYQGNNAGNYDVFVAKLPVSESTPIYSTYLGGSSDEIGYGIRVDASGNAYVTGQTSSQDFPTRNAFQTTNSGSYDVFVTKLNASGNDIVYSTYLGGSSHDYGYGLAVDPSGIAYLTGQTFSMDFPTVNPIQENAGGGYDAFIAQLNSTGGVLLFSTYLGGISNDWSYAIAIDYSGGVYVTGETFSSDFPKDTPMTGADDIFVTKIGIPQNSFFPEITAGGGWTTTFALASTGAETARGDLFLNDQQGHPLTVNSSELGEGSSFPTSIPSGGVMFLNVDLLNPSDPSKHGWAHAETLEGTLDGVATYQFESEGVVTALAGVLPSQPIQFATIPVDDDASKQRLTAYAIANPTDQNLTVNLCFVDTAGTVVNDTPTIQLGPGEQIARYFSQDWDYQTFEGTVVFKAQDGRVFVAVALIQNQALFTVVPVIAGKAPHIPE